MKAQFKSGRARGRPKMVQILSKALTLAEFLALPETKPASEYVDGQIIQKPIPKGKHSAIQGELAPAVNRIVKPNRIARAFPELRCTFGDRSIEILSPESKPNQSHKKHSALSEAWHSDGLVN
jgi:hypothetical protein